MYKFPGTHKAPKLTQEGIENMSSALTKHVTKIIKKLPAKTSTRGLHDELHWSLKN